MSQPLVLTLACAALILVPLDGPRFAPEEGSSVNKTFEELTTLSLDLAEMQMGGQAIEPEDLDLEVEVAREFAVVDTYAVLGDGRPAVLRRSFDELGGTLRVSTFEGGSDDEEAFADYSSELEGLETVFTWDEEDEEYAVEFGEDDADEDSELLEGLLEDADLRALLPGRDADEGDEWELEPARLAAVLRPLGDVRLLPSPAEDSDPEPLVICTFFAVGESAAEVEGEATARLASVEDGVATIEVELDLSAERDAQPEMILLAERLEVDDQQMTQMDSLLLELSLDGTASLEWDLEAGRARAFRLEADVEVAMRASAEGGELEMTLELSGETEITLETEEP